MSYGIYPNATPEFRNIQKSDGTIEMQVRYVHKFAGYTGKWMPIQVEKENDTNNRANS